MFKSLKKRLQSSTSGSSDAVAGDAAASTDSQAESTAAATDSLDTSANGNSESSNTSSKKNTDPVIKQTSTTTPNKNDTNMTPAKTPGRRRRLLFGGGGGSGGTNPGSSSNSNTKHASYYGVTSSSGNSKKHLWKQTPAELTAPVMDLHAMDVAIQTADARIAASDNGVDRHRRRHDNNNNNGGSSSQTATRTTNAAVSGNQKQESSSSCVLVSPEGDLLWIPNQGQQADFGFNVKQNQQTTTPSSKKTRNNKPQDVDEAGNIVKGEETDQSQTLDDGDCVRTKDNFKQSLPEDGSVGNKNQSSTNSLDDDDNSGNKKEDGARHDRTASLVDSMEDDDDEDEDDESPSNHHNFNSLIQQYADDYKASMFIGHDDLDQASSYDNDSDCDDDDDRALTTAASNLSASSLRNFAEDGSSNHVYDPTVNRNGFSARGWSVPATTFALDQTHASLQHLHDFVLGNVQSRAKASHDITDACQTWRCHNPSMGGVAPNSSTASNSKNSNGNDWQVIMGGGVVELDTHAPSRVGPLLHGGSSLNMLLVSLQMYQQQVAEEEYDMWNLEKSDDGNGDRKAATAFGTDKKTPTSARQIVSKLQKSVEDLQTRHDKRQAALTVTQQRASIMEERLRILKEQRDKCWNAVYQAEESVTVRMEELLAAKSRRYEQERLEQMRQQAKKEIKQQQLLQESTSNDRNDDGINTTLSADSNSGKEKASQEDIWNMVHAATERMEQGDFEPVNFSPRVSTKSINNSTKNTTASGESRNSSPESSLLDADINDAASETSSVATSNTAEQQQQQPPKPMKLPTASRDQLELDVGLPGLRRAAMDADHAVQDTAGDLLTILANLDTTQRSARLAAETALVAAGQAQVDAVQGLVTLERQALEGRLEKLRNLENVVHNVHARDVRRDLNSYITADKRELGGASHLREDDDGGIASALAVLSSHVDWHSNGGRQKGTIESNHSNSSDDDDGDPEDGAVRDMIIAAVNVMFDSEQPSAASLAESVQLLHKMATDESSAARARRSAILYAMNSKRSTCPKVPSRAQFDGLSAVCGSILTGCCTPHCDDAVPSAKMCIMLSQTFYIEHDDSNKNNTKSNSSGQGDIFKSRSDRVYIKGKLKDHQIWSNDDFWDDMLGQQITESLTHSGVMSNFEAKTKRQAAPKHRKSEWAQAFRTRWHDLNHVERTEAASQVQAVVFAQLSALAHSMIEFGCGLQRSCAFVRRMAIRNQLPSSQRTMLLQHLISRDKKQGSD